MHGCMLSRLLFRTGSVDSSQRSQVVATMNNVRCIYEASPKSKQQLDAPDVA